MWNGIADRVTDLIFRVEQFDPEFLSYLGSRLEARPGPDDPPVGRVAARRRRGPASGGIRQAQDAAIAGSQTSPEKKREPVRNVGKKVGRNDPCPCGSGKKFKACCMRKQSAGRSFLIGSAPVCSVCRRRRLVRRSWLAARERVARSPTCWRIDADLMMLKT